MSQVSANLPSPLQSPQVPIPRSDEDSRTARLFPFKMFPNSQAIVGAARPESRRPTIHTICPTHLGNPMLSGLRGPRSSAREGGCFPSRKRQTYLSRALSPRYRSTRWETKWTSLQPLLAVQSDIPEAHSGNSPDKDRKWKRWWRRVRQGSRAAVDGGVCRIVVPSPPLRSVVTQC
jgi:hypothetical protein